MPLRAVRPLPRPAPLDEPRYSVQEAAEKLGLKKQTVYNMLMLRKIGCFKVGHLVRIPESEITRILEAGWQPRATIWEPNR